LLKLVCVLIFMSDLGLSQSAYHISTLNSGKELGYQYLTSPTAISIQEAMALNNWKPQRWPPLYPEKQYWVKFDIVNDVGRSQLLTLVDEWVLTDQIEVYITSGNKVISKQWDSNEKPIEDRLFGNRFPTFSIGLKPGTYSIYVKYVNTDFPSVRLKLYDHWDFTQDLPNKFSLLGIIFGSLAIMAVYNFFIFLVLKDRAYLWYSGYISCFISFEGILSGYFFAIGLPESFYWRYVMLTFANLTMVFVQYFTRYYLQLEKHSFFYKSGNLINNLLLVAILIQPVSFRYAAIATIVLDFSMIAWVLILSFVRIKRRQFTIYVYAIAWTILAIGDFFTASYYVGFLPSSFLTNWGLLMGTVIEAALISFGLAWKVNVLRVRAVEADVANSKLSMARAIQELMIADGGDIRYGIKCRSMYRSAEETGGDWLFVRHSDSVERIYAVVADVTGHGVGSAIITGLLRGNVESTIAWVEKENFPPEQAAKMIVEQLNIALCSTGDDIDKLVSANVFVIEPHQSRGYYINAGHLACLLRSAKTGKAKALVSRGSILGVGLGAKHQVTTFDFNLDDYLFTYTDGVIESENENGDYIKKRTIKKIITSSSTADEAYSKVVEMGKAYWRDGFLQDDVSFLLISRKEIKAEVA